jgi:hypothetical protein
MLRLWLSIARSIKSFGILRIFPDMHFSAANFWPVRWQGAGAASSFAAKKRSRPGMELSGEEGKL